MSDFFNFDPDCFDKPSPPALKKVPAIADDAIPDAPDPVFQCPPPEARPGPLGDVFLHIRIVDPPATGGGLVHDDPDNPPRRVPWRHAWEGVEKAADGAWIPTGESGSPSDDPAADASAVSLDDCRVIPGGVVYLARRVVGSRRVVFAPRRVPFHIRLTEALGDAKYAWEAVERDADGTWVATGEAGGAEDPAVEANGREADADSDDAVPAQRNLDGAVVFAAPPGDSEWPGGPGGPGGPGEPGGGAPGRIHWCQTPEEGVPPAGGSDLPGTTASMFLAAVYRGNGSALEKVADAATIRWWYHYAVGPNRTLALAPGEGDAYDVIDGPCPCGTRVTVHLYGECQDDVTPVSGATVNLRSADGTTSVAVAETDSQGNAHFADLPAAQYSVTAYKADCSTASIPTVSTLGGDAFAAAKLECVGHFGRICAQPASNPGTMTMRVGDHPPVPLQQHVKTCVGPLEPGDYLVTFENAVNSMGVPIITIPQTVAVGCVDVLATPVPAGVAKFQVWGCAPIPGAEIAITDPNNDVHTTVTDDEGRAEYVATVHGHHDYEVTVPHAERFVELPNADKLVGGFNFEPPDGLFSGTNSWSFGIFLKSAEGYRCCGVLPPGVPPSPFPMRTRVLVSTAVGSTEVDLDVCRVMAHIPHVLEKCMEDDVETVSCLTDSGGVGSVSKRPPEWVSKSSCLSIYAALGTTLPDGKIAAHQAGDGRATPYWYRTDNPDPSKSPVCGCNLIDYQIPGLDRAYRAPASCVDFSNPANRGGSPTSFTLNSVFPYSVTLHFDDPGNGAWEVTRKCREDVGYRPTGNMISTDVTISEAP